MSVYGNVFTRRPWRPAECELHLSTAVWGRLSSRDLPAARHGQQQQQTCVVTLPQKPRGRLVVDLVKLNVPCKRGRLHVSGHRAVCGKLEDLRDPDRHYVLDAGRPSPASVTWSAAGRHAFALTYRLAAACFDNDVVAQQNGTVVFTPGSECRYKVTQPYGYRLRLTISSVPYGRPRAADAADYDHATVKPSTVSISERSPSAVTASVCIARFTFAAVACFRAKFNYLKRSA